MWEIAQWQIKIITLNIEPKADQGIYVGIPL
jgi:hypothetical protein